MSFHTDEALLRYEHVDVSFKGCAVLHDISISSAEERFSLSSANRAAAKVRF